MADTLDEKSGVTKVFQSGEPMVDLLGEPMVVQSGVRRGIRLDEPKDFVLGEPMADP